MNSDPLSSPPVSPSSYDALLLVSFGGPEGPQDVMPFLENVVRGKDVPRQRLLEVARHYELFDGVSPINGQNRALLAALIAESNANGPRLPIYWGNRNWHPMLDETVAQMAEDGVQRALAFVTSPFGSYPGCRQYLEDIELARQTVGPAAPRIDKLRLFYNHPGFIHPAAERVAAAWNEIPPERREQTLLLFTAHSIPVAMAERSPYEQQLREAMNLVIGTLLSASPLPKGEVTTVLFDLAFQSRSGPLSQPWLEPDIRDRIRQLPAEGIQDIVVVPISFLAENMEVVYRCRRANQFPGGEHGSRLRPRRGSRRAVRRTGHQHGPCRCGGQSSALRAHDPRTGHRAARSGRTAADVGLRWPLARSVPRRLLPACLDGWIHYVAKSYTTMSCDPCRNPPIDRRY
jgi:protoporphyrin/coproporphyrin ferrochelatase